MPTTIAISSFKLKRIILRLKLLKEIVKKIINIWLGFTIKNLNIKIKHKVMLINFLWKIIIVFMDV